MKDSSTTPWQHGTDNVTEAILSTNSPIRMVPQTSEGGWNLEHLKYSPIQPPSSTGEIHIVEAAPKLNADATG
jgi:hypothetical protein